MQRQHIYRGRCGRGCRAAGGGGSVGAGPSTRFAGGRGAGGGCGSLEWSQQPARACPPAATATHPSYHHLPLQLYNCTDPYRLELARTVSVDPTAWPARGVRPAGNLTIAAAAGLGGAGQPDVVLDLSVKSDLWDLQHYGGPTAVLPGRFGGVNMMLERLTFVNLPMLRPPFCGAPFFTAVNISRWVVWQEGQHEAAGQGGQNGQALQGACQAWGA